MATWFSSRKEGTGQFHIMCPMEKYISGIRKHREAMSRRFIFGVSLSFRESSASAREMAFPWDEAESWCPFSEAPYPASSTAAMISDGEAAPSTPMEFVRRLTEQDVTPGTLETAFSTLALQAAQLMPVTLYCSIQKPPCYYFISF